MKVHQGDPGRWDRSSGPSAVTIGVFDGVHLGHRALIGTLGQDLLPTILTFEPHPIEVLRPGSSPRLITTIEERLDLLEGAGAGQVGVLDLSDIKDLDPDAFISEVLVDRLAARKVVVGPDFRFGRDRSGDTDRLVERGEVHGFDLEVISHVSDEFGVVSSSRIRGLIEAGDIRAANMGLGSRYSLTNEVIRGDSRGKELGFPTANLSPPSRKVVPGAGVYAAFAYINGVVCQSAVNVGVRPTFGGGELLIEAFLIDFDDDIYGQALSVEFVERLRPELRFDDVADLISRMNEDVARSRAILDSAPVDMS